MKWWFWKKEPWVFVGHIEENNIYRSVNPYIGTKDFFPVRVAFYMTESGKRKIEVTAPDDFVEQYFRKTYKSYADAVLWEKGGPFPEAMKPERDTLGAMLNRLVTDRLTRKEE